MRASYKAMTPFMTAAEADQMLRIAEARGVFRTYAEEALSLIHISEPTRPY